MKISIAYRLKNKEQWTQRELTSDEYFDLDAHEIAEVDSVPLHNHACEYLRLPKSNLAETKIAIRDNEKNEEVVITEVFWNQGDSRIIESILRRGPTCTRELIVDTTRNNVSEILRFRESEGLYCLNFHSMIERTKQRSEIEHRYFPIE